MVKRTSTRVRHSGDGWVYFLRPVGERGPVKIGHSIWPEKRFHQMLLWSPVPLEIAARIPGPRSLESQFHARFMAHHSHFEWFTAAPEIDAVIAALKAGSFDFDQLPPPLPGYRALRSPDCLTRSAA